MRKNKKYLPEFKQEVVNWMRENNASYGGVAKHFGIEKGRPRAWLKIYEKKGFAGFYEETRGRGKGGGRPPNFKPKETETLEQENERLRAENAYLKKIGRLNSRKEKAVAIAELRRGFSLNMLLEIAEIPRSSYYHLTKEKPDKNADVKGRKRRTY